ncbi:MAG: Putative glycosyltransferase [uncultured Gemmatimonadaceae bacterium]|uniref:Glycosyltransferase n=1 Tax=uncultured Gemmatimonadaceae bacterium TaxID=246130 RepID=A0A6J4L9X4_9BACT|nr:MAG: Putative glycosyltransferase [uncultured Gemmatimonadaceae bacterium]
MTAHISTATGPTRPAATTAFPLIVQSHLRWDFVWQRPQQLLSRMAAVAPVLFVEEPLLLDDVRAERLEITEPVPNVFRAVPRLPGYLRGDYDRSAATVRALVQHAIEKNGPLAGRFSNAVQWFYTPMPAPTMLGAFNELGVVYDCMDELAQFRFAPADLGSRERLLLDNADVVFTGGHRLYESKRRFHSNVHFFGCAVDAAHFAAARAPETVVPADVPTDRAHVFGYYGVIDERLDYQLIGRLAAENPDASVVMVGPVVKVDPRDLPQGPNIHWLGQRDYAQLPAYVKGFDVCLMPFALNEATEYINPTKTLEYMAAGKPIVSTAVADVVRNFTPVVSVAQTPEEFVALARGAAESPNEEMIARGLAQATAASWESTVRQMRGLIRAAVQESETRVDAATGAARVWREPAAGATRAAAGAQEELSA